MRRGSPVGSVFSPAETAAETQAHPGTSQHYMPKPIKWLKYKAQNYLLTNTSIRLFTAFLHWFKRSSEFAIEDQGNDQGYPVRDYLRPGEPIQAGHSVHEKEHGDLDKPGAAG